MHTTQRQAEDFKTATRQEQTSCLLKRHDMTHVAHLPCRWPHGLEDASVAGFLW